ncbi:hypothetical protein DPMN_016287 [Dreissena polymorpha]|uniref:Uncharacterized protein n=1 Tax=Dreissena polymorpha TaxID=45954 RepID=A0A9D4NAZ7_DREPO|nr:hypothetical protein DPMN_016287 [Dreissena polymorpha]
MSIHLSDDKEEHVSILEECAAIRAVSVREGLASIGQNVTMETVAVVILAELQEEQDREVALTLQNIENMVRCLGPVALKEVLMQVRKVSSQICLCRPHKLNRDDIFHFFGVFRIKGRLFLAKIQFRGKLHTCILPSFRKQFLLM